MKMIERLDTAQSRLIYTLFSEETENGPSYGISVRSELFGETEISEVRDITSDVVFAGKLLCILADNLVLPSTLKEIVEEYLAAMYTV